MINNIKTVAPLGTAEKNRLLFRGCRNAATHTDVVPLFTAYTLKTTQRYLSSKKHKRDFVLSILYDLFKITSSHKKKNRSPNKYKTRFSLGWPTTDNNNKTQIL